MTYVVEGIERVFEHKVGTKTVKLPDPDPKMSPQDVMQFYAQKYPELTNTNVLGPEIKENKQVFSFTTTVGTKG